MFKKNNAFGSFSVDDLQKANDFYKNTLGMEVTKDTEMEILRLKIGSNSSLIIYPKKDHIPASFTILNFPVNSIEKSVEELKKRGVKFEKYDNESIKTDEKGILRSEGTLIAWFKDPAGNILSVIEQ